MHHQLQCGERRPWRDFLTGRMSFMALFWGKGRGCGLQDSEYLLEVHKNGSTFITKLFLTGVNECWVRTLQTAPLGALNRHCTNSIMKPPPPPNCINLTNHPYLDIWGEPHVTYCWLRAGSLAICVTTYIIVFLFDLTHYWIVGLHYQGCTELFNRRLCLEEQLEWFLHVDVSL